MATKRKSKAWTIKESEVKIRIFMRGEHYWFDVRTPDKLRQRFSAKTSDHATAEELAKELAKKAAKHRALGVEPASLTIGQLFTAYADDKLLRLEGQWKRGAMTRARLFLDAWGESLPIALVTQSRVDAYCSDRRARRVAPAPRKGTRPESRGPLRDGALSADFAWLSSAFNWAVKEKLLVGNPLHACEWPHEKNIRRPIASNDRYVRTLAKVHEVDPSGRLRLVLVLARYTGRRESAILQLWASDILLSAERIGGALASAGKEEGLADHMPDGAIHWRAANDKQGVDRITPIAAVVRREIEVYLATNPRVGDVALFPSPSSESAAINRVLAARWLIRAETLAGVAKLTGGVFHPFRRLWASERKHLADIDVATAGGWGSTKTLQIYQQTNPAAVLAAVVNGG